MAERARWPKRGPLFGRPRPLGARGEAPIGSQRVGYARCNGCRRVVRDDYLVLWRVIRTGRNKWGPYRRPYYQQLCWRCLVRLGQAQALPVKEVRGGDAP